MNSTGMMKGLQYLSVFFNFLLFFTVSEQWALMPFYASVPDKRRIVGPWWRYEVSECSSFHSFLLASTSLYRSLTGCLWQACIYHCTEAMTSLKCGYLWTLSHKFPAKPSPCIDVPTCFMYWPYTEPTVHVYISSYGDFFFFWGLA